jgi:Flp pilus assembly protein TadG
MQSRKLKRRKRGSVLIEFTLVGIPALFLWVSILEMARGMWQYHTVQYACKMAAAYASVHGATCGSPNSCLKNMSDVVGVFQTNAIGVPMANVSLTLTSASGSVKCTQVSTCSSNSSWSTTWPPTSDNAVGNAIQIRADYSFSTALSMFWPGAGKAWGFGSALGKGKFDFPGYSYQIIQF